VRITKYLSILAAIAAMVILLSATSCGKSEEYKPDFTLADGYTLTGDVISGTVYGEYAVMTYDIVSSYDSVTVFSDSTGEQYVEDGEVPLAEGKNRFVLRFTDGNHEREYHLEIELILLESFKIRLVKPEKAYHIGEKFDKSSILIEGLTSGGKTIRIDRYDAEYEFSDLGKSTVGIEIGGIYRSFEVDVTEEYIPVLGSDYHADGVSYSVGSAGVILLSAPDAAGFFAVPQYVISDGIRLPVTEIAQGAFENCQALTGVRIPDGIRVIGEGAFSGCSFLEWVDLPETLDALGRYAFSGCTSLFSASVSMGICEIPDGAFLNCTSLVKITLSDSVTQIGDRSFSGCTSLSSVEHSGGLRSIGISAFEGCCVLRRIVVGRLELLGSRAFADCTELSAFACAEASDLGEDVFLNAPSVVLYAAKESSLLKYGLEHGIKTVTVGEKPCFICLPEAFGIGSEFPYRALCAVILENGKIRELDGYTILYDREACGNIRAEWAFNDFTYAFSVFVSYVEPVAFDTDSRGAVYELDTGTRTARLVALPEYVKKSSVFMPETEGLFLVPTAVVRDGVVYTVTGVEDGILENCRNISELFLPDTVSPQ